MGGALWDWEVGVSGGEAGWGGALCESWPIPAAPPPLPPPPPSGSKAPSSTAPCCPHHPTQPLLVPREEGSAQTLPPQQSPGGGRGGLAGGRPGGGRRETPTPRNKDIHRDRCRQGHLGAGQGGPEGTVEGSGASREAGPGAVGRGRGWTGGGTAQKRGDHGKHRGA